MNSNASKKIQTEKVRDMQNEKKRGAKECSDWRTICNDKQKRMILREARSFYLHLPETPH